MAGIGEVRIAWWNTSLAPLGRKERPSAGRMETASRVVRELLSTEGVDLLALGEVTPSLLDDLCRDGGALGYASVGDERASPRSDVGAIYDARRLHCLDRAFIERPSRSPSRSTFDAVLNVALRLVLQPPDANVPFQVFALHWPSRRRDAHRAERGRCAETLQPLMVAADALPSVALGDFNDEPFDPSIVEQLSASRDRGLVERHPSQRLYNPTWKLMGSRAPDFRAGEEPRPHTAGSHFFTGPDEVATHHTRWYVLDQVIASAQMLGDGPYHLDDESVRFWSASWLLRPTEGLVREFDHLPILATLRYDLAPPPEVSE